MIREPTLEEWRARARRRLPRFAFDFVEGGAGAESGMARNRTALERLDIVPRRLVDVSQVDLRTTIFGDEISSPMIVAPTGLNGILWPNGDQALARAADVPFVLHGIYCRHRRRRPRERRTPAVVSALRAETAWSHRTTVGKRRAAR